jgi:crotonobetainyl-CoA:carnitine CoA-transferase CaiB-like acyl-CoA transferase
VVQRPRLLATLRERLAHRSAAELTSAMEKAGLPFAPIRRPEDLFDDEHLLATGGLADVKLPDGDKAGQSVKTTLFPITMQGQRLGVRLDPPRLGEHSRELLATAGFAAEAIDALLAKSVVA